MDTNTGLSVEPFFTPALRIGRLSSTVGDTVVNRVLYAFTPAPGGRGSHPHGHSVVLVKPLPLGEGSVIIT